MVLDPPIAPRQLKANRCDSISAEGRALERVQVDHPGRIEQPETKPVCAMFSVVAAGEQPVRKHRLWYESQLARFHAERRSAQPHVQHHADPLGGCAAQARHKSLTMRGRIREPAAGDEGGVLKRRASIDGGVMKGHHAAFEVAEKLFSQSAAQGLQQELVMHVQEDRCVLQPAWREDPDATDLCGLFFKRCVDAVHAQGCVVEATDPHGLVEAAGRRGRVGRSHGMHRTFQKRGQGVAGKLKHLHGSRWRLFARFSR